MCSAGSEWSGTSEEHVSCVVRGVNGPGLARNM